MATKHVVTGDYYRIIDRRMREIKRQLDQDDGSPLNPEWVAEELQRIIEGRYWEAVVGNWLEEILDKEREAHRNFFGQEFDLTAFQTVLRKYGPEEVSRWRKLLLEPHFLPLAIMPQDVNFPGWKKKPKKWYYEQVAAGRILRRQLDGKLSPDREAFTLPGKTILIDTRLKPQFQDGKQMFRKDNLLGPVIERLRKNGEIAKYEYGPQSSRFGVSAIEWEGYVKPALAEFLRVEVRRVMLESAIVANVIPQLYPHMPRKDDGETDTLVWYEEFFEDASARLCGGASVGGGLSSVLWDSAGCRWELRAVRPLVVLDD